MWQSVDIHDEIESSLTLLNHLLKDRVSVHRKYGELPDVECIRSQMDQVFLNLLANAAQAIPGPGAITIETRRDGPTAVIGIADTGPVIPPEYGRIFDQFSQPSRRRRHRLGLASATRASRTRRRIRREPRGRRRDLHRAHSARPDRTRMTAEATVLIVDDEPRVLDSLEALLAMDYRVLRADRPEAALDLLAREEIALVISDQRMPGMSGTELLSRSCEVAPETVRCPAGS